MMDKMTFSNSNRRLSTLPGRQRGVVLIVSLILLMVLTLIGVTAMQTSTLEERMAGNAMDRSLAFQAAEAALRAGENELDSSVLEVEKKPYFMGELDFSHEMPTEPWLLDNGDPKQLKDYEAAGWAKFDKLLGKYDADEPRVIHPPRYAVELLPGAVSAETLIQDTTEPQAQGTVYRVTAVGWGATEDTQVILQSFYMTR